MSYDYYYSVFQLRIFIIIILTFNIFSKLIFNYSKAKRKINKENIYCLLTFIFCFKILKY
jgi:hypothetical protein